MKFFRFLETTPPFVLLASSFLFFGWVAFLLALFGFFFASLLGIFLILPALAFFIALGHIGKLHDWTRLGLWIFLILFVTSSTLSAEPSVFSGRDQGSIAEASWRLAENHQLGFQTPASQAFFSIYGPGTALNFPGFSYTENGSLMTQFPLGYTSFVASFLTLFGIKGYLIANSLLLFLFLSGIFELLLLFVPSLFALGGTSLALFSFLPVWISRLTLTENLASFLFVLLAFFFIRFLQEKTLPWYWLALFTSLLLLFTRIEGFLFLGIFVLTLLVLKDTRRILFEAPWTNIFFPALLFLFIFLRDFFMNLPFYTVIGKAVLKTWHTFTVLGTLSDNTGSLSLGSIFFSYGLLILFLAGLLGIVFSLYKRNFLPLTVLLLSAPTLLYLFVPSITPDHPWMLRRYYSSLYPTFVFFTTLGLYSLSKNKMLENVWKPFSLFLFLLFLAFQGRAFVSAYTIHDNAGLLGQTEDFSKRFGERDLILIDRLATGDPYTLLAGPMNFLSGKQAVYFFNPNDLSRLDLTPFDTVYLLSPEDSLGLYTDALGEKLLPTETVSFTSERLIPPKTSFSLPERALLTTDAILFKIKP